MLTSEEDRRFWIQVESIAL